LWLAILLNSISCAPLPAIRAFGSGGGGHGASKICTSMLLPPSIGIQHFPRLLSMLRG